MTHHRITSLLTAAALGAASSAHAHDTHAHDASAPGSHHHGTAAIGEAGDPAKVQRTVHVDMSDSMRFAPANIDVAQGETVRFMVKNVGQLKHEFVLGTDKALKEHYALMKKFPEMEHADPNQVTLQPGQTGEVVWHFTQAGKVPFACLQPGHYDAGMKGQVKVASRNGAGNAKSDGHASHSR